MWILGEWLAQNFLLFTVLFVWWSFHSPGHHRFGWSCWGGTGRCRDMNELVWVVSRILREERQLGIDCHHQVACSLLVYVRSSLYSQCDAIILLYCLAIYAPHLVNCNVSALAFILIGITCFLKFMFAWHSVLFLFWPIPYLLGLLCSFSLEISVRTSNFLVFISYHGRVGWLDWHSTDTNRAQDKWIGRTDHQDWDAYVERNAKSTKVIFWFAISIHDGSFASDVLNVSYGARS